jgi:hypothetical protein
MVAFASPHLPTTLISNPDIRKYRNRWMGGFTARISRDHVLPRPARLCSHRRPVVPVPVSKWLLSLFSLSLFHLLNARVLMMNSLFVLLH